MSLGKSKLVDVSLSQQNVWTVSSVGNVFFHRGLQPTASSWVSLGSTSTCSAGAVSWAGSALKHGGPTAHIVHIFAGTSCDWMVSMSVVFLLLG